jgi:hypothetical protein
LNIASEFTDIEPNPGGFLLYWIQVSERVFWIWQNSFNFKYAWDFLLTFCAKMKNFIFATKLEFQPLWFHTQCTKETTNLLDSRLTRPLSWPKSSNWVFCLWNVFIVFVWSNFEYSANFWIL